MKKFAELATAAGGRAACRPVDGRRQRRRWHEETCEKGAAAKTETYAVVRIGDDVQIVKKSDLANLKKTTAEEDKKAKKDYDDAKKAAKSKEDKADLGKPPVKRKVIC